MQTAIIAGLVSWSLFAEPAKTAIPAEQGVRADKVDLGPIAWARSMLKSPVRQDDDQSLGEVSDVILDVGRGRLDQIEVQDGDRRQTAIEAARLAWKVREDRARVATVRPKAEQENPSPDDDEPLLVRLRDVGPVPVFDSEEAEIGQIVDFGVATESGQIAYAAMELNGGQAGQLYPVPIAAFVIPDEGETWVLEIPADVLAGTPTFSRDEWPDRVTRNWVEYVHVRYGRPPLGGVQRELHEAAQE